MTRTSPALPAGEVLRPRYWPVISRDPAVATRRSTYAYVGNNPLNRSDPRGLATIGLCTDLEGDYFVQGHARGCHANDTHGGAAVTTQGGLGVGWGKAISISSTCQIGTAQTIGDLAGPFGQFSITAGLISFTYFWGSSPHGGVNGINIRPALGCGGKFTTGGAATKRQ
jgi:hypothetical protein